MEKALNAFLVYKVISQSDKKRTKRFGSKTVLRKFKRVIHFGRTNDIFGPCNESVTL